MDCKAERAFDTARYCDKHFEILRDGGEVTLKSGQKRTFETKGGKGGKGTKGGKGGDRGQYKRKAQWVSLQTPDGQDVTAEMDESQLTVLQAVLGGAKFKKQKDEEPDEDALENIQRVLGYAAQ